MFANPAPTITSLILALVIADGLTAQHDFSDYRALWVTRFDYRNGNADRVRQIVDNAANLGITDLLFQVRGHGDAYYDSNVEPRSSFIGNNWDPLQTAIDQSRTHGMRLHAWINTMPLWSGTTPPSTTTPIPAPFYHQSPSYRIHDLNGNPQPLQSSYVIGNPILPEWHDHVSNIAADIATNYDVDGIHLDYVRWLGDTSWQNLPHDADSYQLFTATTGQSPTAGNASAYRQFIRDRITQLVTQVGDSIDTVDSNVELSAAVWRDPDVGSSQVLQQYRTWMERDLVDTIIPMIYLSPSNNNLFVPNLTNVMSIDTNARVAPGIGVYLHDDPDFTVSQLQTLVDLNAGGATLFAYDSFFGSGQLGVDRFNTIKTFLDSVDSPGGNDQLISITDFEVDEGYFGSSATFSGSNSGIIAASADRVTTEAFRGVGSQQIDVNGSSSGWLLRHVSGIGPNNQIAAPSGNLPLDSTGHVGVWLKTFDEGIDVRLAVDDPGTADRGVPLRLIADGQWHLYEWSFDNNAEWEAWVTGDGLITGETVTLDSIQFFGSGDATIWMDEVGQNSNGSLWSIYVNGDINDDGDYDCADVDQLVAAIATGSGEYSTYDLNGDGQTDAADLSEWLAQAGNENLGDGISFLPGDANLDGLVDVSDFNRWNSNKFTTSTGYCGGDFNADGVTDVSDFNLWNTNKFQSSDNAAVPEPPATTLLLALIASVAVTRRNWP